MLCGKEFCAFQHSRTIQFVTLNPERREPDLDGGIRKIHQKVKVSDTKQEKITVTKKQLKDAFNYNSTMQGVSALAGVSVVFGIVGIYEYTDSASLAIIAGSFALFVFLITLCSWLTLYLLAKSLDENFQDINTRLEKIEGDIVEGPSTTDAKNDQR
jgi:hypothetical protein